MEEEKKEVINQTEVISTPSMIERAEAVAARIEAANKRAEELVLRNESAAARSMLSGRSDAGTSQVQPKIETPLEYKNKIMRGGI